MSKDFKAIADDVSAGAKRLREATPETMKAFAALGAAAYPAGAISAGMKEVIALVIGVSVRCDGCVAYHARSAKEKGATREEVVEALAVMIQMGGGPAMVYAGQALQAFDEA